MASLQYWCNFATVVVVVIIGLRTSMSQVRLPWLIVVGNFPQFSKPENDVVSLILVIRGSISFRGRRNTSGQTVSLVVVVVVVKMMGGTHIVYPGYFGAPWLAALASRRYAPRIIFSRLSTAMG